MFQCMRAPYNIILFFNIANHINYTYTKIGKNILIYIIKTPTSNLELLWITPEYVDYHWVAQGDLENRFGEGFTKELKSVILNLDIKQKSHKQILDMFNAKRFIKAESKQYKNIEEIGRKLNKIR